MAGLKIVSRAPRKRKRLVVSVTELQGFQGCKRRWRLGRQYESKMPGPDLWFGAGIHHALEGYWKSKRDPGVMYQHYFEWAGKSLAELETEYGDLWPHAVGPYKEILRIGEVMLSNYVEWDREAEPSFVPLRVEKRFWIPLGEGDYLTAQLDLIAHETGNPTAILIVDHKTASRKPATGQVLDIDEQLTGYAFVYWTVTKGKLPDSCVYDVLMKEEPAEPYILKDGTPSTAQGKIASTTHSKYLAKLNELGLDPEDYSDVLESLAKRGWSNFFYRESSPRNEHQVRNYQKRIKLLMADMRRCLDNPEFATPSPHVLKCPRCPFLSVCNAMEDGSNAQHLLDSSFRKFSEDPWQSPPRHTTNRDK